MDDRLRAQQLSIELNLPLADSRRFDSIPIHVVTLLPAATLAALRVVPLAEEDDFVILACAEPEHFRYMKELARYLKRPVRPVLAARRDIARALRRFYQVDVPAGWLGPGEGLDEEDNRRTDPPFSKAAAARPLVPAGGVAAGSAAPPAEEPPPEPVDQDATIPMTAEEVQRVLAEYASQLTAMPSSAPAAAPPAASSQIAETPVVASRSRSSQAPPALPRAAAPAGPQPAAPRLPTAPAGPPLHPTEPPVRETSRLAPQPARPARFVQPLPTPIVVRSPSGGRFLDRYQLVRKLATGGMAEVYLARAMGAEGFQREVVVKKILPCYTEDPSFVEMFIDEAKISCRLNHPNIAQVYELAIENDEYYMAMEYVDGKDLLTIMDQARRKGPRLPATVSAYIVASVLEGLEHAHRKRDDRGMELGIIHRDITPSNILVSYEGHVKIIDFGIAKAREKLNVTRVGYMKGKPGYLAPEQAKGERLDRRVDIFAAGILLYELLSNHRLFPDSARASVMAKLVAFDVNPLVRFNLRLPWSLRGVVRKALALAAEDRFSSALEMAEPLYTFMRRKARRDPRMELSTLLRRSYPHHDEWEGPSQ